MKFNRDCLPKQTGNLRSYKRKQQQQQKRTQGTLRKWLQLAFIISIMSIKGVYIDHTRIYKMRYSLYTG